MCKGCNLWQKEESPQHHTQAKNLQCPCGWFSQPQHAHALVNLLLRIFQTRSRCFLNSIYTDFFLLKHCAERFPSAHHSCEQEKQKQKQYTLNFVSTYPSLTLRDI